MTIQIKCPNGHKLKANDSHAGKTGKCPVCQSAIRIPAPDVKPEATVTDGAVLDMIGPPDSRASLSPSTSSVQADEPKPTDPSRPAGSASPPRSKTCPSCERDIDIGYHICPHCHTYLSAAGKASSR